MTTDILLVDDDVELCHLLGEFLETEGFRLRAVHDGNAALSEARRQHYDIIVLDIMLPGRPGLEVLRELRRVVDTPVLMLTARGEDSDRILGLELGADDYLAKPCNPRELAARLRAVLRRSQGTLRTGTLQRGLLSLNPARREASYNAAPLPLTSTEFNLLASLLARVGQAVDKETLSQEVLGRPLAAYDRSVDVHISKIRKKLAAAGAGDTIVSIRGHGYQLLDEEGDA